MLTLHYYLCYDLYSEGLLLLRNSARNRTKRVKELLKEPLEVDFPEKKGEYYTPVNEKNERIILHYTSLF